MQKRSMAYYIRRAKLRDLIAKKKDEQRIAGRLAKPANENTRSRPVERG